MTNPFTRMSCTDGRCGYCPRCAQNEREYAASKAEVSDVHQVPVVGLPVAGYKKTQPQWALDLVNENKILEEKILRQIDGHAELGAKLDQRAVALARTKIQEAFMWLNRGVFQPERIDLPEEDA